MNICLFLEVIFLILAHALVILAIFGGFHAVHVVSALGGCIFGVACVQRGSSVGLTKVSKTPFALSFRVAVLELPSFCRGWGHGGCA